MSASSDLHPAQHRGIRELIAMAYQLHRHWDAIADRLPEGDAAKVFRSGSESAWQLATELAPVARAHGLPLGPAAEGAGRAVAALRGALRDRALERNQALRLASLEAQHVTTLLRYLQLVSEEHGPPDIAEVCAAWDKRFSRVESVARKAAVEIAHDPDAAIEPLDQSALGTVGQRIGSALGGLGEASDRVLGRHRDGA
ncbi:MAG: hypothetical protein ACJ76V_09400 [Thermoleophilaceae bacterium]